MLIRPMMFFAASQAANSWDPNNKSAGLVLSNNNLSAYPNTRGDGAKSIKSAPAGDICYEIKIDALPSGAEIQAGFSLPTDGKDMYGSSSGVFYVPHLGYFFINGGSAAANVAKSGTGDIVGLRYNFSNGTFYAYKNGSLIGSLTGYNGKSPLAASITMYPNASLTANFGTAPFSGGLPSGAAFI